MKELQEIFKTTVQMPDSRAAVINIFHSNIYVKDQKIYPQYGATKTPHVYVLEKTRKGNEVKYIGAIDDNYKDAAAVKTKYVENAVDALLSGKEVEQKETRAIGCSIKVK